MLEHEKKVEWKNTFLWNVLLGTGGKSFYAVLHEAWIIIGYLKSHAFVNEQLFSLVLRNFVA